ncbi:MAG: RNA polymerase factor sigma-54 [Planctomycetota bacterium]
MSQSFSQSLVQQMRMEQRLTPQLIQSMAILQKPVADLESYINDALESNAALEIAESLAPEQTASNGDLHTIRRTRDLTPQDDGFGRMERFSRSQNMDFDDAPAPRAYRSDEPDSKMGALANTPGRTESLSEHLLDQWRMLDLDVIPRQIGEALINHLDPDGYLRVAFEDAVDIIRPAPSLSQISETLLQVQSLEPTGIGARDIVECLLLQLDQLPGDNQVERTLVKNHLEDLAHNRLPLIAKATGYSIGEIKEAMQVIRTSLSPHPGYLVGDRRAPIIRPDLIVEYADSGGGLTVRLARGNLPSLRINEQVADIAKSKGNGKETKEFARKQVEAATSIIDAVLFRRSRLMEVGKAIVEKQRAFFDIGPEGLKVYRMSDLAVEMGCDPSTISRTVSDKHVQTPRGIYPLRYFFTGGTETDDGESVGWDRVKTRVRELVDNEEKKNPLNDDQIAAILKAEGIELSRRTVAKYRQQLDIPTARQRREY